MQAVEAFDAVLALVLRPEDAEFRHVDRLFFKQEPYFPGDVKRNTIPPRGAHFASDIKRLAQPRGGGDVLTVLHVEQREVRQRDRHLAVFMEGLIELLGVREQLARDLLFTALIGGDAVVGVDDGRAGVRAAALVEEDGLVVVFECLVEVALKAVRFGNIVVRARDADDIAALAVRVDSKKLMERSSQLRHLSYSPIIRYMRPCRRRNLPQSGVFSKRDLYCMPRRRCSRMTGRS